MTLPMDYENPTLQFERFMVDARDFAQLQTTNMVWNMVVGVLHTFRRRLTVQQGLLFASVLPAIIRGLFVENWDTAQPVLDFGSDEELYEEVCSVRTAHNFSPPDSISAVAKALRKQVNEKAFDAVLQQLPIGSERFWASR